MFPAPFAYMFNLFSVLFVYLFDLFCCVQMLDYPCFLHLGPMQVGTQSVRLSYPTVSSISFFHIRGFLFPSLAVFHYLQRLVSAVSFIAVSFSFFFYLSLSFTCRLSLSSETCLWCFFHCRLFLFPSLPYISLSFPVVPFAFFLHNRIFIFLTPSYLSNTPPSVYFRYFTIVPFFFTAVSLSFCHCRIFLFLAPVNISR